MELVSVIIPTFNRYKYLLNAINSVKNQTYKHIEIIVVNDCSTHEDYNLLNNENINNIIIINLEENSKNIFGFACAGYVRNKGIEVANGKYIAFLDDDDYWLPNKIELQLDELTCFSQCLFVCSDALYGNGIYDKSKNYSTLSTDNMNYTIELYKRNNIIFKEYPQIFDFDFLKICNSVCCSSAMVEKELLNNVGNFKCLKNGQEDYDLWLRLLKYTKCLYVKTPLLYYDNNHGEGQNY